MIDYTLYLINPNVLTPVLGLHVVGPAEAMAVVTQKFNLQVTSNGWEHRKWGVILTNADNTYILVQEKCKWAFQYITQEVNV